eukprot:437855-Pelagomonas_calceolata.AAC.3
MRCSRPLSAGQPGQNQSLNSCFVAQLPLMASATAPLFSVRENLRYIMPFCHGSEGKTAQQPHH